VATASDIEEIARRYLRDFPKFFQTSFTVVGRTYELGQINVDSDSLWVALFDGATTQELNADQYDLDERNGVLRLLTLPSGNQTVMVEGYYYEWVTPGDLSFYAHHAIEKHVHTINAPLEALAPVVIDTIGMAAVVETLWALMTEYSRDIDVITSESVHIPASQRFRMVQSLLQFWDNEYRTAAKALNIGLERLEVLNLRRVSRLTNRLVPLYKAKELGDYSPMERIWPPIDDGTIEIEEGGDSLREDVYVDTTPPSGLTTTSPYFPPAQGASSVAYY